MRFTFLSAHCVQGLAHPSGEADITLFADQATGIRVQLTADATQHLHVLNRHLALMSMMLRGMIGSPLEAEFRDQLIVETATVANQRRDSIGSNPVVIVEIVGKIEAQVPANAREIQDFLLCFDAFDKKALKIRLQSEVSAVLTALRTGTGTQLEFRHVCDGSYVQTDGGKVVHSASAEIGTPDVYVSRRLTKEQQARVGLDISLALKAGPLERVMRLHAQSFNKATDNYRAFVAAWSALEILIGGRIN